MTTPTPTPAAATPGPWWLRLLARTPLPLLRAAGSALGAVLYVLAPARRRTVQRNLALCFPIASAAERRRWAWATFRHFGQSLLDRVWLWHAPLERVLQRVHLEGDWQALQRPGPVVVFAPHFFGMDAAWTLLTARIARPWAGLYAPAASARLDAWAQRGRQRFGAPQIVSRRDGLRGLVRALQQGHAVYLLPDLDTGPRHSVFAPFCSVLAATVTTLPRLAGLADAPVVPVRAYLTRSGYRVQVEPPWPHYPSGDDEADVRAMNAALTRWVMQAPEQYHWLHRRFKTRPPGEPPLY